MRTKSSSKPHHKRFVRRGFTVSFIVTVVFLSIISIGTGLCGEVDSVTARLVAENTMSQHIALYGDWNGTTAPMPAEVEAVDYQGRKVAYNVAVRPSGHVLVAVDDALSPVLLYSARSTFDARRVDRAAAVESWIIPELHYQVEAIRAYRSSPASQARTAALSADGQRIAAAWSALTGVFMADHQLGPQGRSVVAPSGGMEASGVAGTATVGPLLTTAWGQSSPYNRMTPPDACSSGQNTLTGCVATAWAQLLRYWSWPIRGTGSHSYDWEPTDENSQTLSVDFNTAYQWDQMPDVLSHENSEAEMDAVSELMFHMGVAAEMDYGCDGSGSNAYADEVLGRYFNYRPDTLLHINRADRPYSGEEWFALIRAELDADPPRPVVFSIFEAEGGHEVIIDGYQTSPTHMVHINFGWEANYDGFYNITVDFPTGDIWWGANNQDIVIGIAPDNLPPTLTAGEVQTVDEQTVVQLNGHAEDPEGVGIRTYRWTQLSGPTVSLSDTAAANPSFVAPNVHAETQLVFQLRADDLNRAHATDTCTITISNTDGSSAPPSRGSGSGGGGCFVTILFPILN